MYIYFTCQHHQPCHTPHIASNATTNYHEHTGWCFSLRGAVPAVGCAVLAAAVFSSAGVAWCVLPAAVLSTSSATRASDVHIFHMSTSSAMSHPPYCKQCYNKLSRTYRMVFQLEGRSTCGRLCGVGSSGVLLGGSSGVRSSCRIAVVTIWNLSTVIQKGHQGLPHCAL